MLRATSMRKGIPERARPALLALGGSCLLVLSLWAPAAAGAVPQFWKYLGIHPVSPLMGAFCYIDVLHVHPVQPPDMRLYVVVNPQEHLFVGDPVTLGYDGPRHAYFGPHPLVLPVLPATQRIYCYIAGPHFHADQPPRSADFASKDGVYWYMGKPTPEFERDGQRTWINETHAISGYRPPGVDISAAPPGYHPLVVSRKPEPLLVPGPVLPAPSVPSPPVKKPPARSKAAR